MNVWLVGQAVKTSPSHGENRGSIPLRAANCFYKQPNPKRCSKLIWFRVFFCSKVLFRIYKAGNSYVLGHKEFPAFVYVRIAANQ